MSTALYTDINNIEKPLFVNSYAPTIDIDIDFEELENGKVSAVGDYGYNTDKFKTTLTFSGLASDISELYKDLYDLRIGKTDLKLSEFQTNIFSDNVDYSNDIHCVISPLSELTIPSFNVMAFSVVLTPTDLIFNTNQSLPSLKCLGHDWYGSGEWNTKVVETYTGDNYFYDRGADIYRFEGIYNLTSLETSQLIEYWRAQRGNLIYIIEGDWGVSSPMFGPNNVNLDHYVFIEDIEVTYTSLLRREIKIKLIKDD